MKLQLSKEEIAVIAITLIALTFGIGIELVWGSCTDALSRSGSFIVCLGIVFGALDFKSVYERKTRDLIRDLNARRLESDIVFSDDELDDEVRGSTNYFIRRANAIKESGQKRVIVVDAGVLIVGTLISGFGDLVI